MKYFALVFFCLLTFSVLADSGDALLNPSGSKDLLNQSGSKDLLNQSGSKDLLNPSGTKNLLNPSASRGSADDTHIDPKLCNALVKHTPSADTAYQPGVDASGNPVTAADLPGAPQMKLPEKIDIPLTVSLAKVLNLNTTTYPNNQLGPGTESWLGTLSVEGDNVTFNGKPLSDEEQDKLAVLCMKPD